MPSCTSGRPIRVFGGPTPPGRSRRARARCRRPGRRRGSRRRSGRAARSQAEKSRCPDARAASACARVGERGDLLDVGAGDEVVRLAAPRDEHAQLPRGRVRSTSPISSARPAQDRRGQDVELAFGVVEGEPGDALLADLERRVGGRGVRRPRWGLVDGSHADFRATR